MKCKAQILTTIILLIAGFGTAFAGLNDGLVAYYPFNGNANDESGNNNGNGSVFGATLTTDRFGNISKAYNFDGIDDYIEVLLSDSSFDQDFTIGAWVKFNNFDNSYPHIFSLENVNFALHGCGPIYGHRYKKIGFYQQIGSSNDTRRGAFFTEAQFNEGEWHFIVVSRSEMTYKFYIDTILEAEITETDIPSYPGKLMRFGSIDIPGLPSQDMTINGSIDDVRIYNRAISDSEIQVLNAMPEAPGLNNGLIAYYPFNGNANDESGNGKNGTVNGAALITDRFGIENSAYSFDGIDSEIRVANPFNTTMQNSIPITISVWMKTSAIDDIGGIVTQHAACSGIDNNLYIILYGSDSIQAGFFGNPPRLTTSSSELTDNSWHHVVASYSGDSSALFIDGILKDYIKVTWPVYSFNPDIDMVFGGFHSDACGSDHSYEGSIDDIRIYNRLLSYTEVQELAGRTVSEIVPKVKTFPVSDLTDVSAIYGGKIQSDFSSSIVSQGICWSTSPNPSLANDYKEESIGAGDIKLSPDGMLTEVFFNTINGLDPSTTYYIKAYATYDSGTVYGNEISIKTRCVDCTTTTVSLTSVTIDGEDETGTTINSPYSTGTGDPLAQVFVMSDDAILNQRTEQNGIGYFGEVSIPLEPGINRFKLGFCRNHPDITHYGAVLFLSCLLP